MKMKCARMAAMALVLAVMAAMLTSAAYADLSSEITGGLGDLFKLVRTVTTAVAVVAIAVAAVAGFMDGKHAQAAKTAIITALILVAVVWLAPVIVNTVQGWFANSGAADASEIFGKEI